MEIRIHVFWGGSCSLQFCTQPAFAFLLGGGESSLFFETGQRSGGWCFPAALAFVEVKPSITVWLIWELQLSCPAWELRDSVTFTFLNQSSLSSCSVLHWSNCSNTGHLLACCQYYFTQSRAFLSTPSLCCAPAAFCSKSYLLPEGTDSSPAAPCAHRVGVTQVPALPGSYLRTTSNPTAACPESPGDFKETIFLLMESKMVFFIKSCALECLCSWWGALWTDLQSCLFR